MTAAKPQLGNEIANQLKERIRAIIVKAKEQKN